MSKANSWKEFFVELGKSSTLINEIALLLMSISSPIVDDNNEVQLIETVSRLSCDKGDSILLAYSKSSESTVLYHNVCDLGNTNLIPDTKLVTMSVSQRRIQFHFHLI